MRPSKYNLIIVDKAQNRAIIFNTLYGSITQVEDDEVAAVEGLLYGTIVPEEYHELYASLLEQRYFVDDNIDELALVRQRKSSGIHDTNRLDLVIMPTLACNFACTYCYETHRASHMTDQTVVAIKSFLLCAIPQTKLTMLHWFGGEPLLGYDRVVALTRYANEIARAADTGLIVYMTTNGYLLNDERIATLVDTGIKNYQITLDGTPENHDHFRPLLNGDPTFEMVYTNIVKLARADNSVSITVRCNFNHDNINSIPDMLTLFPLDIRQQLRVVFEPIFGDQKVSATCNMQCTDISATLSDHYAKAATLGYGVTHGGLHTGRLVYCNAERRNQMVINYNGDLFKCSVCDFTKEERLGYLAADGSVVRNSEWEQWDNIDLFGEKCSECQYLPLCMGGCKMTHFKDNTTGDFCTLIPTNVSYMLKQIALGTFDSYLQNELPHEAGH